MDSKAKVSVLLAGGHDAGHSFNFILAHDSGAADGQENWRFCTKCFRLFFNGFDGKGVCPAGGPNDGTQSLGYVVAHDAPGDHKQSNWRFCAKCFALFFNGFDGKGVCPAGGGHDAGHSFDFDLRFI
jgi:hypothetical protein